MSDDDEEWVPTNLSVRSKISVSRLVSAGLLRVVTWAPVHRTPVPTYVSPHWVAALIRDVPGLSTHGLVKMRNPETRQAALAVLALGGARSIRDYLKGGER